MDSSTLLEQMKRLGLWPTDDKAQQEMLSLARKHGNDVRTFCRDLMNRNVLTPHQVNYLLTGKGQQLLVGPYIVMERLGAGGMGQVFKARHRHTHLVVALKVIKPARVANPVALARFFREVQAVARLDDRHIVRAFDADDLGGTPYFAMEYVHGTDLASYVKSRGPLPIELACKFLAMTTQGLQHIHEHGMVHRDIKPGNLMAALEEQPPTAAHGGLAVRTVPTMLKILDLGLARLGEDQNEGDAMAEDDSALKLTHDGIVIGTADYMSPEQARNSSTADIRSDIYSLGCTFYFALTGQVPFPGGATVDKILRHQFEEPAPLDKFRPHVPSLLAGILKKMMAKRPADRYQTPADLSAALDPLVSDAAEPPVATPVFGGEQQTLTDPAGGATAGDAADAEIGGAMLKRRGIPWSLMAIFAILGTTLLVCAFWLLVMLLRAIWP
jgi:serine/threonine-protein kinase